MSRRGDGGPVIDLATMRTAQRQAETAHIQLPEQLRGRVPVGFKLVPVGPVWQLLMVDPRDPNDEGVLIACGPQSSFPVIERIISELNPSPSADG